MRFAAVFRSFIVGDLAIQASNEALGVWLRLQSYATSDDVETPRLAGARKWNARRWLVACQLASADVKLAVSAGLARWDSDDLVIEGFDSAGLEVVKARRQNGKLGAAHGIKGGRKKPVEGAGKPHEGGAGKPHEGGAGKPPSPSPPIRPGLASPPEAPSGAAEGADGLCEYHKRGNWQKKRPDGPIENCETCRDLQAKSGTRRGQPETSAALLGEIAKEQGAA